MMNRMLCWMGVLFLCIPRIATAGSDIPKDFYQKLKDRYEHQKLIVLPPNMLVGLATNGVAVHYDHFYASLEIPKGYQKRNNFDDRTTEEVQAEAGRVDHMEPGETLSVVRIQLWKRSKDFYAFDLYLNALAQKRLALTPGMLGSIAKAYWELTFRFAFPPQIIEEGNYQAVVDEINKYFLPEAEYQAKLASKQQAKEASKTVEIQPGMSKEQVIQGLGEPEKTIVFGKRTLLRYQDITVTLEDNKVVEVKPN
jgi:hypothetical protein